MILTELFQRQAQPLSGFVPSKKWLSKGLELVFVGDQMVWSRSKTGGCLTLTKTGTPKTQLTKFGRLPGFGSTYGTGTTDRLDGGALPRPASGWRSIISHYYANSTGGGGRGRIFQDLNGGTGFSAGEILYTENSAIYYGIYASSAYGFWFTTAITTGRWQSVGFTHDQRTINVAPSGYLDGASVGVTIGQTASGTYQTTPCNMVWGNRPSDSARVWDGIIGPTLIFDGALTADDHFELDRNPWQVFETDFAELWGQPAGGTTITCTVGNASAAGPSALVNASISSTVGNASAAGVTAAVNASIAATVGNAAAAGVTALVSTTVQTSTGNAVAAGVTANVNATIQTSIGNATAAGVTATISAGGSVTITCSVGNAAASGPAALLNTSIVCSVGNAGSAGVTALIQSGVIISASVGNAVAAGITALLHKTIQTATGNVVAAGITASILGAAGQQINAPRRNRSLFDSAMRRPAALSTRHRPWH